ncbi:MAG: diguanylate cyclase [Gemmatimonadaceae bacterium]
MHSTPRHDLRAPTHANAEVLLWQGRVRIGLALAAGGVAFILQQTGVLRDSGPWLFVVIAGYMAIIGLIGWRLHRAGTAGDAIVGLTIGCDLVFIFWSTIASATPAYYYRILILSFFVLHLTESYFGRRHAALALGAVSAGYVGLTFAANRGGAGLSWTEQLWSLGLFAIAGIVFIMQYGSFRLRLERIVALFESAQEGDFAAAYNADADTSPDAITRVGRAYNRVRLQLASMVLTDPLTGCLNRRGLDQAIAREIARSGRSGSELSILAIDLDHFKAINDTHGHVAGDIVLREFGALLVHTARAGDIVARAGGEEFLVLLPDTDLAGAHRAALRLCDSVRTHPFLVNGKRMHLTISIGVASTSAIGNDSTGRTMIERSDEALYDAKRDGRDRAKVWNGELAIV